MAAILPSRFAVLKVEGEDPDEPKPSKKAQPAKTVSAGDRNSVTTKPKPKKKKKPSDSQAKPKAAAQTGQPEGRGDDWETWKKRDDQFVSDAYEQDLQQALLLSRLDYEEKKEFYEAQQKEAAQTGVAAAGPRGSGSKNKKKNVTTKKEKKMTTMSLEEFNQLGGGGSSSSEMVEPDSRETLETRNNEKRPPSPVREAIFEQVAKDAKSILSREQRMEEFKNKQPFLAEHARTLQFQDELEKKDEQIAALKQQIQALAAELKVVKLRNKQLCNILAQGEMQDKAEILRDFEVVTQVKDELTQQVTELHAALEQERSKVRQLQQDLKKGGRKEAR